MYRQGAVTKVMSASLTLRRDWTKEASFSAVPSPWSTVSDLVAASASGSSVVRSKPWAWIFWISADRKAC